MDTSKRRFFIALLPPQVMQDSAREIQHDFAQTYKSKQALKSPPHITLQPPFDWELENVTVLEQSLTTFAQTQIPVPVTLKGFGAFKPRVIYVNVLKTPELLAIQTELKAYLKTSLGIVHQRSPERPFAPHLTVAFRDLTRQNFRKAWPEFEHRELDFEFSASQLTLLIHDGRQWTIHSEFPLSAEPR